MSFRKAEAIISLVNFLPCEKKKRELQYKRIDEKENKNKETTKEREGKKEKSLNNVDSKKQSISKLTPTSFFMFLVPFPLSLSLALLQSFLPVLLSLSLTIFFFTSSLF